MTNEEIVKWYNSTTEELGIDLITLFKALMMKNISWYKKGEIVYYDYAVMDVYLVSSDLWNDNNFICCVNRSTNYWPCKIIKKGEKKWE